MPRVDRTRRSAKDIIETFAEELLNRKGDPDIRAKLLTIETIALRMSWNELYNRLRWKSGLHVQPVQTEPEAPEQWWQK